ncbi:thermonuclease family protein [Rhizobium sp. BG4]|uniref:thermonuclease family protein n=1 Tax=Rhizobium sp. BG4 TaxID=2613770 RepID=UPI00193DFF79|nr:thermonuclease family protein [Rhizobium sp. BG4]
MKALVVITAALLAAPALASDRLAIVDGDTLRAGDEVFRIIEIDTPETYRPRCAREYELGVEAREHLAQLLSAGPVRIERDGIDFFGRTLARVYVGERNIGEQMIADGVALRYRAGAKFRKARVRVWCPDPQPTTSVSN